MGGLFRRGFVFAEKGGSVSSYFKVSVLLLCRQLCDVIKLSFFNSELNLVQRQEFWVTYDSDFNANCTEPRKRCLQSSESDLDFSSF